MSTSTTPPITFTVTGQSLATGVAGATAATRGAVAGRPALPGQVKAAVRMGDQRGATGTHTLQAVPGEDIVALHIAGGPVLLLHPENARDLLRAQSDPATTRGGGAADGEATRVGAVDSEATPVGAALRWQGLEAAAPTRGPMGDVLLAAFELLTGFGKEQIADFAASQVVARVDAQVEAGVYRLSPEALEPLKGSGRRLAALSASTAPVLVFIHGTFVETTSTFGKLWTMYPQRVRQLFQHYGGRVYALEHETLGQSPIGNALELVKALPRGTRLHLVTHSRGGLVAEVLARMAHQRSFAAADAAFFEGAAHDKHRAQLRELAAEMKARDVSVERVVRVACPARGTLLASKRLDAYLSVLGWALAKTGVPLLPAMLDFVAEVARRRADPALLPGMAAMMPDTPLLNWLNAAPGAIAGELRVVAGDLEGDSLGSWLKTLLTDAYYWTDNDIVVQTRSMYAGAPRAGGASFLLDQGGKTTHFAYFANVRTVDAVVEGLVQPLPPPGFATIGLLSWQGQDAGGLRGSTHDPAKPAVFVLPGILGSNLAADGQRIWLDLGLIGGLAKLTYMPGAQHTVKPDGPISMVYSQLAQYLGATHEVITFDYDWRVPIEEEARRLAQAVTQALDARQASGQPVQLLAHSMGGVLARCLQLEAPAVWERLMQHPQARLLMLGTPNGGSWAPMQVLSGDDTFGNTLAAFGSPLADRKARQIMAGMPGFLQLQAGLLDPALRLDRHDTWATLATQDYERMQQANWWHRYAGEAMEAAYRWGVPPQEVLDAAKALRERLDTQLGRVLPACADKLCLVVGQAAATPVGFENTGQGFVYLDAADGDGRVPLASALLPGVRTWQLDGDHGSLPSAEKAFAAFVELLQTGDTAALPLLSADGRTRSGGAHAAAALKRSRPSRQRHTVRPASSQRAVFGGVDLDAEARRSAAHSGANRAAVGPLRLSVLNGNLSFIAEPLLVGHYTASTLTGTEFVIDRLLGGTLVRALAAGLYPAALGTHQVFVNTRGDPANPWREPRPRSVLVVGLGDEGELREAEITTTVRQGVLAWAQRLAEQAAQAAAQSTPPTGHGSTPSHALAATLLGSGGLGIGPGATARAIARGVAEANQRAAAVGWPTVQALTLVELYLDRATEAWNGLQLVTQAQPALFTLASEIRSGTGPLRRQLDSGYRGADFDLIRATTPVEGQLAFVLDSRRARTEVRSQPTQIQLVRELLASAATDRNDDPRIGRTLFQLLVPTEIEPFLAGAERMVIELDTGSAALPWELLDSGGSETRPWALRSQLLRRLQRSTAPCKARDASADHDVLIIGDPLIPTDWQDLPHARAEALAVQAALCGAGGLAPERVVSLVDKADAQTVIGTLLSRPWRVVHVAGHGEAPAAEHQGGVVLSGGLHLGAAEIRAMRTVPELVFVNCCDLAAFENAQALQRGFDPGAFAANVAESLIDLGVRCVVASGWPVNDGPAAVFADTFYGRLLEGARFIDAVGAAREACWAAMPQGKTWAAYQCYGDPDWVWRSGTGDAQAPRQAAAGRDEFADIASAPALALALETVATRARFMGGRPELLSAQLNRLAASFAARWGGIGAVAEAFAVAWHSLKDFDQAITWYERAVAAADASASLRAEEHWLNLRARQAWAQVSEGLAEPSAQAGVVAEVAALLQDLAQRRPSAERFSLLGSANKRLALLQRAAGNGAAERLALQQAMAAYRQADALAAGYGSAQRYYALSNLWALALCLNDNGSDFTAADRVAVMAALKAQAEADPSFFNQAGAVEMHLFAALGEGTLPTQADALAGDLAELQRRHAAPRDWSSVADQAALVLTPRTRGRSAAAAAARRLLDVLTRYAAGTENA